MLNDNINVLKFITEKLLELREMIDFNITTAYQTRTYIENNIIYQQCIATLNAIAEIIDNIPKLDGRDNSEDEETEEDWLKRTYDRTYPVYDPDFETGPIYPNLFSISINNREDIYPIQEFKQKFIYNQLIVPNTNVYIKFIKRVAGNDKLLSVCGMLIKQIN